jgi:hypothetical protein
MSRKITVTVDPAGTAKVEAHGFRGAGCVAATRGIEEALGMAGEGRRLKPEYNEASAEAAQEQRLEAGLG